MAPFGQVSLRFVGSYCGRCCGGPIASRPLSPSTMTSRGIGCGRRDQRDPAATVMDDLVANTLRTAAGLAKAATGQQQPGPPIAFRRLLVAPPPPAPIVLDRFEFAVTRPFQERRQLFWRQRCEQFGG